jgi:isoamylase
MATKFAGSLDRFGPSGRQPPASINFITCHDGFSLRDLYSNTATHNNQPFPFGPSPGGRSADEEMCWDQGGNLALQRQAARNGLALVILSAGVPMFCGGDEFYRTQFGNSNMFNVDTNKNWLDPAGGASFPDQFVYLGHLIAFSFGCSKSH